jgi:Protein of unknown function (DUF1572)
MAAELTTSYLEDSLAIFRQYKKLAEDAMAQVSDAELTTTLDPEMNSIALVVKHMAGNMRSRWTDFLTTDGEKPWRDRESEFAVREVGPDEVTAKWEEGWRILFTAISPLADGDLGRTVRIRGQEMSVLEALHRSLAHTSYHVGQIVFLARSLRGGAWQFLTIPPGKSDEYNRNPTHEKGPRP